MLMELLTSVLLEVITKNTNNLRTNVSNNFSFNSKSYYFQNGLKNNYNLYFKFECCR